MGHSRTDSKGGLAADGREEDNFEAGRDDKDVKV